MKLDDLKAHAAKHAEAEEIPPLEYEAEAFAAHVREAYQEIKPRPDDPAGGKQWDAEVEALVRSAQVRIHGVRIRRL